MVEQQQPRNAAEQAWEGKRRRHGIAAFVVGLLGALAFFAFFPGLPHIIDGGAVLVSLAVGVLARWGWQVWFVRTAGKKAGPD
ncbi:hypothetical protein [Streptomyces sp. NPDC006527]|uniref:hypothetical protein n=1 Tax=Streptomyces sp. NPDC006527 TaxID=3364749 RepID=UPI00367FC441